MPREEEIAPTWERLISVAFYAPCVLFVPGFCTTFKGELLASVCGPFLAKQ